MSENSGKGRISTFMKVLIIVLASIIALCIGIGVKFYLDLRRPAELFEAATPLPTVAVQTAAPTPAQAAQTAAPTPSPTPDPESVLAPQADTEFMKNRVNILMLGIDESAERESWGSFRTDTMILVTIDFDTNDVDMISIPRDSFVKIYTGNGSLFKEAMPYEKINSAFSSGGGAQKHGFEYAMTTVSMLTQVPVTYYVGFNMNVVKEVVDAMGGVDYDVDVQIDMNGRTILPGYQHLDGQQVLDYCRMRKADSDIHRVDRQQRMIAAIVQQLKTTGQIANVPSIYTAVQANMMTNLTLKQISALALLGLHMDMEQLGRHTVEGRGMAFNDRSYWCIKTGRLEALIRDIFETSVSIDPEVDCDYFEQLLLQNEAMGDFSSYILGYMGSGTGDPNALPDTTPYIEPTPFNWEEWSANQG